MSAVAAEPSRRLASGQLALRFARELGVQVGLGLQADIHPTWISHIESGRNNPTWGSVRRIAGAQGISMSELAALAEELDSSEAQ